MLDAVEIRSGVGVATTTPRIWGLLCAEFVFAVTGAYVDLLEDLVRGLLRLTVVSLKLKYFIRAEVLRA